MQNLIFIYFLSFDNTFGQSWVETSKFKKCLHLDPQINKMAAHPFLTKGAGEEVTKYSCY